MDGLNCEIEVRFGTSVPVPFKDARTGEDLQLRAFGDAMVVVKDMAKFPSVDEVKKNAPLYVLDAFTMAVADLSGSLDASNLKKSTNQLERKTAEKLNGSGLMATAIKLMQVVLTSESEAKLKAGVFNTPMTDDHPMTVSRPMVDSFPAGNGVTDGMKMFPKFCPNCGAKAGSRFCPQCGSKLG
ncbi:MAG: hypothetical protein IKI20_03055 [Lachnospiraceae bacterium]|nr:hypothetical protein [Lachnospiraceae bacterium]